MCQTIDTSFSCGHIVPIFLPCAACLASPDQDVCANPLALPDNEDSRQVEVQDGPCFDCLLAGDPEQQLREARLNAPPRYYMQAYRFVQCGHTTLPVMTDIQVEMGVTDYLVQEPSYWNGTLDQNQIVLFEDIEGMCFDCYANAPPSDFGAESQAMAYVDLDAIFEESEERQAGTNKENEPEDDDQSDHTAVGDAPHDDDGEEVDDGHGSDKVHAAPADADANADEDEDEDDDLFSDEDDDVGQEKGRHQEHEANDDDDDDDDDDDESDDDKSKAGQEH